MTMKNKVDKTRFSKPAQKFLAKKSKTEKETSDMLNILPDEDVSMVNSLVKKLIRAWDPDFTKVTPEEKRRIDQADSDMMSGYYLEEDEFWSSFND